MIKFRPKKINKNSGVPIIRGSEYDELAEMLLTDYKPGLLKEPGRLKPECFLESYFGATLEYKHIYHEEDEGRILGAAAFNKERLKIFDNENLCTRDIVLKENTVVLDLCVTEEGREGLERFTCLHEAAHLWLHPGVYVQDTEQLSIFNNESGDIKNIICCRRDDIEGSDRCKEGFSTPEQWIEYQANSLASTLAMPKATVVPLVIEMLKANEINECYLVEDKGPLRRLYIKNQLIKVVEETYGVSQSAAYVRLRKLGLIKKKAEVDSKQIKLF